MEFTAQCTQCGNLKNKTQKIEILDHEYENDFI